MVQQDQALGSNQQGTSSLRQLLRVFLTAVLAGLVVATCAYLMREKAELVPLLIASALSFAGVYFIIGSLFGIIQHKPATAPIPLAEFANDASGDAMAVTDARGRPVYINEHYSNLLAESGSRRPIGFDTLYAGHPDFATPLFQLVQAAKQGERIYRDVRVNAGRKLPGASENEARWLRLSISPVGKPGHTLWRLTDITRDRQHQEQAFTRLQFIITYLDHAPAGFFSTLPNGKVDYINATLATWLGIDLADSQGGKLSLGDLVGADAAALLMSVVSRGEASRTEEFSVAIKSGSGVSIPVRIMHRADFAADGQLLPMRTMVLKRNADTASADASQAVGELIGSAPFGVAQVTRTGRIVSCNPAFVKLAPKFKIGGLLSDATIEINQTAQAGVLEAADDFPGILQHVNVKLLGDKERVVAMSFVKLPSISENIFAFAVDETESRNLENQLAQSQKIQAVGQLASGIAHDFNNLLTPIIGFSDVLIDKMRPTDPSFQDAMSIKQNAIRAANLVRQLLAFSRKQTLQPRLHRFTDTMADLGNMLGRMLGERVKLKIVHGRDLGYVMVDNNQFEQVIMNLAVNARDAMPNGGIVTLKTYNVKADEVKALGEAMPEADYVCVEVQDSGSGIPAEIIDKIWEPFFSTKDVGKGTGLGLSMVYGIVKQTGGFIFVDSRMNEGTTFRIYLPRQNDVPKPVAVASGKRDTVRKDVTGKGRILVVEDEDSVRAFTTRTLASRGYTVVEANTGEVALEIVMEEPNGFDLILSDVVMPEMDGPTFLSEIRKREIKTKFIFMSGYAEDAFEKNPENPKDYDFLQKPFQMQVLLETVKEVISRP
jgi:two-component system, cell cycle sensor histidine kinase and response regulator CckA